MRNEKARTNFGFPIQVPLYYRETSLILRCRGLRIGVRAKYVCVALRFALRLQSIRRVATCRRLIVPIHVAISSCRVPCPIGNFTLSLAIPFPFPRHRSLLPFSYLGFPFVSRSYHPRIARRFSSSCRWLRAAIRELDFKEGMQLAG